MLLTKFRVTEFRSVQDSGWIDTEQITALIGTNESGKTNIMLPLWKLNPAAEGQIDLQDDLPRDKYHIYRNAPQKPIFIRAQYALSTEEQAELAEIIQCDVVAVSEVIISRDFDGNYTYEFPNEPTHETEDDAFVSMEGVTEFIDSHMPKYVYYSNYGNLDSQIYLPQVLQNICLLYTSQQGAVLTMVEEFSCSHYPLEVKSRFGRKLWKLSSLYFSLEMGGAF